VTTYELALLLHIGGVLVFFAGIVVAGVAFEAGRRRTRPDEIAVVLSLARIGALLAVAGSAIVLACGLWLADLGDWSLDRGWLAAALGLFTVALVLGALGGRRPRRARELATRLAADGAQMTPALRRLLNDPVSRAANAVAMVIVLGILVLMVVKP
jgi:uncharacterized membrane protein